MGLCVVANCGRDAHHRYACPECTEHLRRQVREIETYAAIIAASRGPGRTGNLGDRHSPGYGSRSPARDDALVALDYRSTTSAAGPDDEEDPTRSLLGTLCGITRWLRDVQEVSHPRRAPTITGEILWLLPQIEWCSTRPWVDELAVDLGELHSQSRRLAGDAPPRALGRCLDAACDGRVYPGLVPDAVTRSGVKVQGGRCTTCRHPYDWLELIQVRIKANEGGAP